MTLQLTLERDGHDQPWGFRLQGGVDVGLPLSVLRVLVGTPSEPVLKRGDVISKIGNTGTHSLTHQGAVDLFNNAGNRLAVTVKRGGVVSAASQPSISSLQASAAIKQQQYQESAAAAAATVAALEASGDPTQPYRTQTLVQPSPKILSELGQGSASHLRIQEEICTGVREPQLVPVTKTQAQAIKENEFIMKQKVGSNFRSFRARSPDPSVSIRSLLRPTPLYRRRPAWKEPSFTVSGRNQFRIGGQMVSLKPSATRVIPGSPARRGGFQPKKLMTPDMWRQMLKATPVKAKPKPKPKKEREPLPEIKLRKQNVIQIATRDILEEYCNQVVKEGLPGKKCKPKPAKYKIHEGIVGPATMTECEMKYLPGKRAVQISVVIRRFEEYEDVFTLPKSLFPGPCASFTFSLGNEVEKEIKLPEKTFQSVEVEETVNVTACYDPMSLDY